MNCDIATGCFGQQLGRSGIDQAIQFADIPIMSTYLILIALFFVVINLIVDLLYFAVDPRLRVDRAAAFTQPPIVPGGASL